MRERIETCMGITDGKNWGWSETMKTDKEKFIELMQSFGVDLDVESYNEEHHISFGGDDGYATFIFDCEEKYERMYVQE